MDSFINPIFNLIILLLLFWVYVCPVLSKQGTIYRQTVDSRLNFWFFLIITTAFCTFAFSNGDFFNYQKGFKVMVRTGSSSHEEPVYVWLVNNVTQTYIVWRLIIWGTATYFTVLALKRFNLPPIPLYAALTVCYLTSLYIMRGNLGVAIMLYGLSFILIPLKRGRIISYILGITLFIGSYFFHKSMILSMGFLLPAILVNFDKKKIFWCVIFYPIAFLLIKYLLEFMADNGLAGDDQLSASSKFYAETKRFDANLGGILNTVVTFGAQFYTVYYAYKIDLVRKVPKYIRIFYNYWFVWVYLAALCYFQELGGWYFSRFMYMSNLPWTIFLAYIYAHFPNSREVKCVTIWGFLGSLYPVLYAIYKFNT